VEVETRGRFVVIGPGWEVLRRRSWREGVGCGVLVLEGRTVVVGGGGGILMRGVKRRRRVVGGFGEGRLGISGHG
jgi:hypothetical protein